MKKPRVHYDSDNDVLYISFGDPKPSFSEDLAEGIYARYDMNTEELNGITIVDYSMRKTSELKSTITKESYEELEKCDLIH